MDTITPISQVSVPIVSRGRGRPRSDEPLTATTVLLSDHHREMARRFGNGKLTLGIRRALEALDRVQFDAVQVPQEPPQDGGGEGAA